MAPIPIILCGKRGEVAQAVTENLWPEVEVVYFCSSVEQANEAIPQLLTNHKTPNTSGGDGIATHNFARPPQAVVLGLGYSNETVAVMRLSCESIKNGVPWISGGLTNVQLDDMLINDPPPPPEKHGLASAEKIKSILIDLKERRKLGQDGLYHWH